MGVEPWPDDTTATIPAVTWGTQLGKFPVEEPQESDPFAALKGAATHAAGETPALQAAEVAQDFAGGD